MRPSSAPNAIARLSKLGLVRIEGSLNRRIISLTEAGQFHPQYDALAPKAERLATLDGTVELAAGVLAVMAQASAVRASELVALRPAALGNLRFDFPVWRLVKRGLAEQVEETRGRNRLYRLTAQGRAYAEELQREAIVPAGAEVRAFVARFLGTASVAAKQPSGLAAEPCRQAILAFARDNGVVTAKTAARHLGPQAPALSVIYGHLRTLEARGAIMSAAGEGRGRAPLAWRFIAPAGRGSAKSG
jgi:DNA-binding PadR family transcriptional regulator